MSHYIEDEFNNNSATNDRDVLKNEYSQNKDAEFSSHRHNSIPKDEFSSKNNSSIHIQNNENLNKLTEKAVETGEVATVSSGVAASGIAATASGVIAAAATVTIVAIGTVTGISAVLHDYDYKFNTFIVSSNELRYELFINDKNQEQEKDKMLSYDDFEHEKEMEEKEEDRPFVLRVYNSNYNYSHYLWLGYNYENAFTGLTLGQTYNIVLSENRYGGEVIFEKTFRTVETTYFGGFSIPGTADLVDKTFDVELDYVDSTNSFDDFTLYLEDVEFPEENFVTYTLEPKPGKQAVHAVNEEVEYFDFHKTYNYKFSYKNNGETVNYSEGQVSFYDTSGEVTTFNSFSIDNVVDFEGDYFNVTLDYHDPLEEYYSFGLQMETTSDAYVANNPMFFLATITGEQKVVIDDPSFDFNEDYNYTLFAYTYDGEEEIQTGTVSFQDMYGRESYFDKFIFDKTANFKTEEIVFQLNYVDDFNYFDHFVVTFINKDEGIEIPIELASTTEEQPKPVMEYGLSFEYNYTYRLTAEYKGTEITLVEDLDPFIFEDNATYNSDLTGIMFIGNEAKFSNRSFDVVLEYEDDFDCLTNFILTLYDEENGTSLDIELEKRTEEQTVYANEVQTNGTTGESEYKVDIVKHNITYNVKCDKEDGGSIETITLYDEPRSIKFSNSEFRSFEYTGVITQQTADSFYYMGMKFNYIDENENIFSNWHVIYYDTGNNAICETQLTNDDHAYEWGNYPIFGFSDDSAVATLIGNYCTISVEVSIYDEVTGISTDNVEVFRFENETLISNEFAKPRIYGLTLDNYVTYGMFELNGSSMVYTGDPDMFADVQLVIETSDGTIYTYDLDVTEDSFVISLNYPNEDNFVEDEFEAKVSNPVAITLKYRYYKEADAGTGTDGTGTGSSDPQYELSELIELIVYNDFQFEIGH